MFKKYLNFLKKTDWILSLIVVFLIAFGMMAIYSTEISSSDSDLSNFKKQLIFFGLGAVVMIIFSMIDFRYLKTYAIVFYIVGILLLVGVLVFGTTIRGTKGWLVLFGDQGFQPVELVKIILIIVMAKFLSDWRSEITNLKNLTIISLLALGLIMLVFFQPDFGSAFILMSIFIGMLLMTKLKRSYILIFIILFAVISLVGWQFLLQDYQKDRIQTFINPELDPYGSGYNIKQSIIAVGSGNLFGRGLALGPQSRLDFLPVQETDFIFAVIAEELGFVGSILLLAFIFVMLYRMIKISRQAKDDFSIFFVGGTVIYFFVQSMMNIGMNIGLVPIAGVPLPFVSYGGSSLIVSLIVIGIIQSIHIRQSTSIFPR